MLHEVRKTDAANQALFMQTLHRFPSIYILLICILAKLQLVGWPMDEVEVKIIETLIAQSLVKRLQGLVVATLRVPNLAGNKEILTFDSNFLDFLAHALLIFIDSSGVDVGVACSDGSFHSFNAGCSIRSKKGSSDRMGAG